MKRLLILCAALLFTPASAFADCADQAAATVFVCPLDGSSRQVQVCQGGDGSFTYSYGKPGIAPELELLRSADEVNLQPWNGIGRYIWATLTFDNSGYRYQVAYSADKNTGMEEGYLNVFEPDADEPSFSKACRAGTVEGMLLDLELGG